MLGLEVSAPHQALNAALKKVSFHAGNILEEDSVDLTAPENANETAIVEMNKAILEALSILKNPAVTASQITAEDFCNAAKTGNLDLISEIIAKGMDVNILDKAGRTPLYYARNIETIDYLVKHNADIFSQKNQWDALTYMRIKKKDRDVVQHLKKLMDFSESEKNSFYKKTKKLIAKELTIAKEQDKNLLIMLGESHGSFRTYKAEKIIAQVARELGIEFLYIEYTKDGVNELLVDKKKTAEFMYGSRLIRKCHKKKMQVEGIDNFYDLGETDEGLKRRNIGISQELFKRKKDAMVIVGGDHIKGLLADKESTLSEQEGANKQYHIVPLELTRLRFSGAQYASPVVLDEIFKQWSNEIGKFSLLRENAIQISSTLTFSHTEARKVIARWNITSSKAELNGKVENSLSNSQTQIRENKEEVERVYLENQKEEPEGTNKATRTTKRKLNHQGETNPNSLKKIKHKNQKIFPAVKNKK